jgi:hypothetical protein
MPDPYTTLQVQPNADPELIAAVFQHLLREALAGGDLQTAAALERAYARVRV